MLREPGVRDGPPGGWTGEDRAQRPRILAGKEGVDADGGKSESQVARKASDHCAVAAALPVQPSGLVAVKQEAISPKSKAGVYVPGVQPGGDPGGAGEGVTPALFSVRPSLPPENKVSNLYLPESLCLQGSLCAHRARAPPGLRAL